MCYRLSPGPALVWRTHRLILNTEPTSCFCQSSYTHQSMPPNCLSCSYSSMGSHFWCFLALACSALFSSPCLPNSYTSNNAHLWCHLAGKSFLTGSPVNDLICSLFTHLQMKYCLHVFLVSHPERELLKSRDGLALGLTHL